MFDPFSTSKIHGSGLGLYVSRRIIKANNGELKLYNNDIGGATAEIILPVYKE
jgi:signal transduction histidine kinase